jgi:regulatory associated protein of mTOR
VEKSLLLVCSASGNICIYKDYEKNEKVASAFRAAPEAISYQQGPGIITAWQQHTKTLYCAGELDCVKIWDIEREFCVRAIPTQCETSVTSISCNQVTSELCYVGCGNGTILIVDKRNGQHSVVSSVKEHSNWIVNLKSPKRDENTLISGSGDGLIKFWDIRKPEKSINEFQSQKGNVSALSIHDYAYLIAVGSSNQHIKVFNFNGTNLSTIYYHDGFLSQRIGPISALNFHPFKMCLAAGATDSIVSLYTTDKKMKGKIF